MTFEPSCTVTRTGSPVAKVTEENLSICGSTHGTCETFAASMTAVRAAVASLGDVSLPEVSCIPFSVPVCVWACVWGDKSVSMWSIQQL